MREKKNKVEKDKNCERKKWGENIEKRNKEYI